VLKALNTFMFFVIVNYSYSQTIPVKKYTSNKASFSFSYPSYLKELEIVNAPHMLLKLSCEDYLLMISFWESDNNINQEYYDIWDDETISYYSEKDKSIPHKKIIKLCEKTIISDINNLSVKCLKSELIISVDSLAKQDVKAINYRLVHKNNYLQFLFLVTSDQIYLNKPQFPLEILKGIQLFY